MSKPNFQPLTFSGIIDTSFRMFSQDFKTLIPLSILFNLPALGLQLTGQFVDEQTNPGITIGVALLGIILSIICSGLLTGSVIHVVSARYLGEKLSFSEAIARSTPILGKVISTSILVGLWIFLGILCLIIPGVIWMFTLALALPAVVLEGKSSTEALQRSKELVKHNQSKVVGTVIGVSLLLFLLGAVFGIFLHLGLAAASLAADGPVALVGEQLLGFALGPLYSIALVVLYYDLRIRYEGFDLELLSKEIGA